MSNKSSSVPIRHRTLRRLAAVGGTALLLSSLVMTLAASAVSASHNPEPPIGELIDGTKNPVLSGEICRTGNFNFVVDMSGSIGQQGSIPSNLPALKAGINGFVDAFEGQPDTDGKYAGVRFNADSASFFTLVGGYVLATPFKTAVTALSGPTGLTPTGLGIDTGAGNDANPLAGAPKVMFVATDGSPNVPNTHSNDLHNEDTWVEGGNAAIAAANAARADGYVVKAVYLTADGDPGDVNLPFDAAGDALWATTVMNKIGGGSHFTGDFSSFIDELFDAIDCPLPETEIVTRASENVELGGEIWDTAILSGGNEPGGSITFKLYGPNDADCDGTAIFTDEVEVDHGNNSYTSGKFTPEAAGTYRWIATYSGDKNNAPTAGKCNDANENVTVTEPKEPDIDVEKLVSRGDEEPSHENAAQPGNVLHYQIIVENDGNADAEDVDVWDDITDILEHATYNNDCSNACAFEAGDVLHWNIDVDEEDSVTLTFSVTLDLEFPDGTTTLPNAVVVDGPGSNCPAVSTQTNQEHDACETTTTVNAYLLQIDKENNAEDGPLELPGGEIVQVPTAEVGDTVSYTLEYEVGNLTVTAAVITDVLPDGIDYVDDSATSDEQFTFQGYDSTTRTLSWTAEEVSEGGTLHYLATVGEDANEEEQPLINEATIDSHETDPDDSDSEVFVPAEVGAETSNPTPPQTDSFGANGDSGPGASLPLILGALGVLMLGLTFLTPVPAAVRRRNRR